MAAFRVTIRRRGKTDKSRHATLDEALDALEAAVRAAADGQRPQVERALGREYEPVQQVAVRAELRGPSGLRAGIDVRGDGSTEAFSGRLVRRLPEPHDGEDACSTLRRLAREAGG